MNDQSQRFIFDNTPIRGELVKLDASLKTIINQNDYPKEIQQLLSEALCASALLSAILKYEGQLTLQFQGQGTLKMLVAKCDNQYRIRGTAQWEEESAASHIEHEFASGQLIITIQNDQTGKRFQSIVDIDQQTIAAALEGYFKQSEQLDTRIWLSHSEDHASGLLLQKLPEKHTADNEHDKWEEFISLASTIKPKELLSWDNKTLLKKLFHEEDIQLFEPHNVTFYCPCNAEKMLGAIRTLGEEEAMDILKTNRVIEVNCEYCNNHFEFAKEEVKQLFTTH
jgi:molecular chaperone Hsp33